MTRPTSAAKRVFGVTRLLPAPDETRGLVSRGRAESTAARWSTWWAAGWESRPGKSCVSVFWLPGLRNQSSMDAYLAARLLAPVAVLLIWSFFHQITFFWITLMMGGAYLAPDMWLSTVTKKRREKIRLGLPDAMDLMVVCVDAGLGLDQALLRTGQELGGSHAVLAEELMQLNLEQRAGKPRIDAWRDMADRTQLETVKGFANMLAQSDRFGTPVSKALEYLRRRLAQTAQPAGRGNGCQEHH